MKTNYYCEDFTEENYRNLLKLATAKYNCISFPDYKRTGNNLLLRHDLDASVHRAYKLAKIESEENIQSTFFLWMHSPHYNLFEGEVFDLVNEIIDLGHYIGLHFDASFYVRHNLNQNSLLDPLVYEKSIIEHYFKKGVSAFSFHEPTSSIISDYREDFYQGMVNTYSEYIRNNYAYCSDSNGYWRFKRLSDVLMQYECDNLQILTHPEWWTPNVLLPRERMTRCIDGRSRKQHIFYDKTLADLRRNNVR